MCWGQSHIRKCLFRRAGHNEDALVCMPVWMSTQVCVCLSVCLSVAQVRRWDSHGWEGSWAGKVFLLLTRRVAEAMDGGGGGVGLGALTTDWKSTHTHTHTSLWGLWQRFLLNHSDQFNFGHYLNLNSCCSKPVIYRNDLVPISHFHFRRECAIIVTKQISWRLERLHHKGSPLVINSIFYPKYTRVLQILTREWLRLFQYTHTECRFNMEALVGGR